MQKIIQIHPCLLKLSRKQESVTDGLTDRQTDGQTDGRLLLLYPSPLSRGIKSTKGQTTINKTYYKTNTNPTKNRVELRCSGGVKKLIRTLEEMCIL